jgi:hypothetical protein
MKTTITVTEAARNFGDCVNRAHYQNVTFVLLKNGSPVSRRVPDDGASGRKLIPTTPLAVFHFWELVLHIGIKNYRHLSGSALSLRRALRRSRRHVFAFFSGRRAVASAAARSRPVQTFPANSMIH